MATEPQKEAADELNQDSQGVAARAMALAKAKNMRLRLMKARNENYLAERREERQENG